MPSITDVMNVAEPFLQEQISKAVLEERRSVVREVGRVLDRAHGLEDVREWYSLNLQLMEAVDQL